MSSSAENRATAPNLIQACLPIGFLIVMLATSVALFGDSSSYGPNQIALLIAAAVAVLVGLYNGLSWSYLQEGIVQGIAVALGAILIILTVGALVGTWLLAGIVPTMIYYGLELLDPSWFYAASCLMCAVVAVSIGSSWTTAATIGVALMGIAAGLELSLPIAAGAVVSGAYFGDKMSPLSDTTNLAPAVSGSELFAHMRYMLWVSVPALALALIAYAVLGLSADVSTTGQTLIQMQQDLNQLFNISPLMLIPLGFLFVLAALGQPALPSIFAGALLGAVWALIFQPERVAAMATGGDGLLSGLQAVWLALSDGTTVSSGNETLDDLLSGGGMSSMLNTVWLVICAMTFGGVMEQTGLLRRVLTALLGLIKTTASLITTTILTAFSTNILTADQYIALVLPGRMFKAEYAARGLDPRVLSRSLENGGTITSVLIPWNTCAVFMFGVLGVSPIEYAPYAFFALLVPIIGISYAFLDFKILRLAETP